MNIYILNEEIERKIVDSRVQFFNTKTQIFRPPIESVI